MIGIAIIGTGAIAGAHIQAFKAFRNRWDVRAIVGLNPEKAEKPPRIRGCPFRPSPLNGVQGDQEQ